MLAAAVVFGAGSSAVWTFGRDVVSSAGASELVSTGSWIVLGAAGLLGALAGDVVARLGLARAWSAAMLLVAAATLALGLAASTTVAVFAGAAVFGGVYIALSGMLLLWGTRVFPDRPVLGVGAAFLLLALGQALGAPLLGLLADHLTLAGAFLAATALLVLGAARASPARAPMSPVSRHVPVTAQASPRTRSPTATARATMNSDRPAQMPASPQSSTSESQIVGRNAPSAEPTVIRRR